MEHLRIRSLTEADVNAIIADAGGQRVVADDSREDTLNADYELGEALIELKLLEEEGLSKKERRKKLASLFAAGAPERPVVVLDPENLPEEQRRTYYNLMSGPVKTALKKAAKQLEQTRIKLGRNQVRVLLLINNGYTALTHDELLAIAGNRARNDTRKIDYVVVAGVYYYSDTFDRFFLWPMDMCPIRVDRSFRDYELLKSSWDRFADQFMTKVVTGEVSPTDGKMPVMDLGFEIDGVTFVRPAPPMGRPSQFFSNGRPRIESERDLPVVRIFPRLSREAWGRFKSAMPDDPFFGNTYEEWQIVEQAEASAGTTEMPFVAIDVEFADWQDWRTARGAETNAQSLCKYTRDLVIHSVNKIIHDARMLEPDTIVLARYIHLVTEEIGQNMANDLSSISAVRLIPGTAPRKREILQNRRIPFQHALTIAASYALASGIDVVYFERLRTHAWV